MNKCLPLLTLAATLAAAYPTATLAATESTKPVIAAIEARDCQAAVRELNVALAGGTPEALLLGGAMFEQGLCLKQNVERAAKLYVKASDAGAAGAKSRLAALYALPSSGPDKGAVMWWGLQANLQLPQACAVGKEMLTDAEKFAKALSVLPAATLDACVHVTGVLAVLDAEFAPAVSGTARGGISVDFRPATGVLNVQAETSNVALVDNSPRVGTTSSAGNLFANNSVAQSATPEQMLALRAQEDQQALQKRVAGVAKDALARYPRPLGISADWHIQWSIVAPR